MNNNDATQPTNPELDALLQEAADPATSAERLHELSSSHTALLPALASNPALYPELRDWLASLGDPAVDEGLALGAARAAAGDAPWMQPPSSASAAPAQPAAMRPAAAQPAAPDAPATPVRKPIMPRTEKPLPPVSIPAFQQSYPEPVNAAVPTFDAPHQGEPAKRNRTPIVVAVVAVAVLAAAVSGYLIGSRQQEAPQASGDAPSSAGSSPDSSGLPNSGAKKEDAPEYSDEPEAMAPTPMSASEAENLLRERRLESLDAIDLDGRWVLQLASKTDGQTDPWQTSRRGTHTFYLADIWDEYEYLESQGTNMGMTVWMLEAKDFGPQRDRGAEYWVTLADPGNLTSEEDGKAACSTLFPGLTGNDLKNICLPRKFDPPSTN